MSPLLCASSPGARAPPSFEYDNLLTSTMFPQRFLAQCRASPNTNAAPRRHCVPFCSARISSRREFVRSNSSAMNTCEQFAAKPCRMNTYKINGRACHLESTLAKKQGRGVPAKISGDLAPNCPWQCVPTPRPIRAAFSAASKLTRSASPAQRRAPAPARFREASEAQSR
jgi:hypothetical protein